MSRRKDDSAKRAKKTPTTKAQLEAYIGARNADLQASGLAKTDVIKRLGLTHVLGKVETEALTGIKDAIAYEIPYYGVDGKPIKYSRWKLIAVSDDLPFKYYQEPKTIPHIYIPPLLDWRAISQDVSQRIVLTEGEKKAACACLFKLPTLGLGGVWNWKSKHWNMEVLADFDQFKWQGREVEVCFDGDLYSNENVARALGALTSAMTVKGARVFVRYLPNTDGADALDSFLVKYGLSEYMSLDCPESDASETLHKLNERLIYVKDMISYYDMEERIFYRTPPLLIQRHGHLKMDGPDGKRVKAIQQWIEWPHRRMVDSMTYEPGAPAIVDRQCNDWRPSSVVPKRGEIKYVLDIIEGIGDSKFQSWFLQWLAYPVVHPGSKLYTAVMLWSPEQGTGKTFIGEVMSTIYGAHNSVTISDVDLHDERHAWIKNKQFVLAEEVTQAGRRQDLSIIKHLITGTTIRVNEKFIPAYSLPNKANFYFTSNKPDAMRLERTDRRIAVAEVSVARPESFWFSMDEWHRGGGAAHWMHYLLNNVNLKGFNPRAPAPMTIAKEEMIFQSMSSIEQWAYDLIQDPDRVLGDVARAAPGKDVFTVADLMSLVPEDILKRSGGEVSLGKALSHAGAVRAGVVRCESGARRLIAIRNTTYWKGCRDNAIWAANYQGRMTVHHKSRSKK